MTLGRIAPFALAALLLVGACGSPSITNAADNPGSAEAEASASGEAKAEAPKPAGIGDAITLVGSDAELKMRVKVNKVIANGTPANDFVKPEGGKRLYGVELTLKNAGKAAYSDSPGNGASVIDSEGQEYSASLFGEIAGAQNLTSTTIAPGDLRKGYVVFEVPGKAKIVKLQMSLDSGFADHHGEWSLTK